MPGAKAAQGAGGPPGGSDGLDSARKLEKSQKRTQCHRGQSLSPRGPHSVLPRPAPPAACLSRGPQPSTCRPAPLRPSLGPRGVTAWPGLWADPYADLVWTTGQRGGCCGGAQAPEPRPECWQHLKPRWAGPTRHCPSPTPCFPRRSTEVRAGHGDPLRQPTWSVSAALYRPLLLAPWTPLHRGWGSVVSLAASVAPQAWSRPRPRTPL